MLSAIHSHLATAAHAAAHARTSLTNETQNNSQTVSVQLDSELFSLLYKALLDAGLDPGTLGLPGSSNGQDSGTSQNPGSSTPVTGSPVPVILPSPVVTTESESPVPLAAPVPGVTAEPEPVVPPAATPGINTGSGTIPSTTISDPVPEPVVTPFGIVPPEAFIRAAQNPVNPFARDPVPKPATPAVSQPPAWTPTFQNVTESGPDGQSWPLNSNYFATAETAFKMAGLYGTGEVVAVDAGGSGGPFGASAQEYQIRLQDGRLVNAGILASYYTRNPENLYPGVADRMIRNLLASEAPTSA